MVESETTQLDQDRLLREANRVHQEGPPTLSPVAETSQERSHRELVRQQAQELLRRAGSGVQAEASAQPLSEEDIGLLSELILRGDVPEAEQPVAEGQPPRQERGRLSPEEIRELADTDVRGAAQEILDRYNGVLHDGQRRMLESLIGDKGYVQSPHWEGELRALTYKAEKIKQAYDAWQAKPEWQRNLIIFKRGAQAVASVTAAVVGAGTAAVASAAAAPFVALSELNASRNEAARQIAELNAVEVGDPGYADRVRLVNSYEGADAASNYTPDQLAAMAARYSQFGSPDFDPNDRQPARSGATGSERADNRALINQLHGRKSQLGGTQMNDIIRGLKRGDVRPEDVPALLERRQAELDDEIARQTQARSIERQGGSLGGQQMNDIADALRRGDINHEQAAELVAQRRADLAREINEIMDASTPDSYDTSSSYPEPSQTYQGGTTYEQRPRGPGGFTKAALGGIGTVMGRVGAYLGGITKAGPVTRRGGSTRSNQPQFPATSSSSASGGESPRPSRQSEGSGDSVYYGSQGEAAPVPSLADSGSPRESTDYRATPRDSEIGNTEPASPSEQATVDGNSTVSQSNHERAIENSQAPEERVVDSRASGGRRGKIGLSMPPAIQKSRTSEARVPLEERLEAAKQARAAARERVFRVMEGAEVYSNGLGDDQKDYRLGKARAIVEKLARGEQLTKPEERIAEKFEELGTTS